MSSVELLDTAYALRGDLYRNIVSLRATQDLSDDLAGGEDVSALFAKSEMAAKPRKDNPTINRPFESGYGVAVQYPFSESNRAQTRFSDGRYGVWYGSLNLETTVHETVYWFRRKLIDAVEGFSDESVVGERRVYLVYCDALVFDLREKEASYPGLVDPANYRFCQSLGRTIHDGGHAGVLTPSARYSGVNAAIFSPRFLSNVRDFCFLTYTYDPASRGVDVSRQNGKIMLQVRD